MKRATIPAAIIVAILIVSLGVEAQQERRPGVLEVTGVLLGPDGAPMVGKTIWFLPWNEGRSGTVLQYRDLKPVNPAAESDQDGRFLIVVPPSFAQPGSKFTVGIDVIQFDGGDVARRAGAPLIFTVNEPTGRMDLGTVVINRRRR